MDLLGFYSIFFALLIPFVAGDISNKWKRINIKNYAFCVFPLALVVNIFILGLEGLKPVYMSTLWATISTGVFWYRTK